MFRREDVPTVAALMTAGIDVEIIHQRYYGTNLLSRKEVAERDKKTREPGGKNIPPLKPLCPKGGRTICRLKSKDGDVFEGIAVCANDDHYIKKEGRWMAIGRACTQWCRYYNILPANFIKATPTPCTLPC